MKKKGRKSRIFIDLNTVLDVFQHRVPFYKSSAALLAMVETGQIEGYVAAHSIIMLCYLIQKGLSSSTAHATMTNVLRFLKIAPVDQDTIEQALNLELPDFEDAVQMICAVNCGADCLITRNVKDFQPALIPVMQPADYLSTL